MRSSSIQADTLNWQRGCLIAKSVLGTCDSQGGSVSNHSTARSADLLAVGLSFSVNSPTCDDQRPREFNWAAQLQYRQLSSKNQGYLPEGQVLPRTGRCLLRLTKHHLTRNLVSCLERLGYAVPLHQKAV